MSVALRMSKSLARTIVNYRRAKNSYEWERGFHAGLVCEARCTLRYFIRDLPRRQQKEIGKYIREEIQRLKKP